MFKQALTSAITSAIVTGLMLMVWGGGGTNFAGVTHLSGLSVAEDGLAVTDGGAVSLGTGTISATGTTTITKSFDGFKAWDDFTVATGTAKAVYTNSTGVDMICDSDSGYADFDGTTFAPSLVVALGTTTGPTLYSANLMSSSTVATTTDAMVAFTYTVPFRLASGESITASLSDGTTGVASSTYFTNWAIEFGVQCSLAGA